jgi:hypothetical protein
MADKGYVTSLLNKLDPSIRQVLNLAFEHVIDNLQFGGISHQDKARNFRFYRLDGVTSSVANQEFTIMHGLGQTPLAVVGQYLPLDSTGGQIVRLNVTRVADGSRLYLSSPDTGAAFSVLVES